MYQYDSKAKTQSEKFKTNIPETDKSHAQLGMRMPVQTKSLFSPSVNQKDTGEKSSSNYVSYPAQLKPLTYSPLQMQLIPKQSNKEPQPLTINLDEKQKQLATSHLKTNNKRLQQMTRFILKVASEEYEEPADQYKKVSDDYLIEPTESDPHSDGIHALFLVCKTSPSKKTVYKPRSLSADKALTGIGGMLKYLGDKHQEANYVAQGTDGGAKTVTYTLPEMNYGKVKAKHQPASASSYRTEGFVTRVGDKKDVPVSKETALKLFYQLGMLETAASCMGVSDLHTDNIMFTEQGPIVIDAECSFLDYSAGGTLIESENGPLKRNCNSEGMGISASLFYIKEGGVVFDSVFAYKNKGEYKEIYEFGKKNMLDTIRKNLNAVALEYSKVAADVDMIRIVPVATQEFANQLHFYIGATAAQRAGIITGLRKEICENLKEDTLLYNIPQYGYTVQTRNNTTIEGALTEAFNSRTIPACYLNSQTFNIMLDHTVIAMVQGATVTRFGETMKKQIRYKAEELVAMPLIREKFLNKIKEMDTALFPTALINNRIQELINMEEENAAKKSDKSISLNQKRIESLTSFLGASDRQKRIENFVGNELGRVLKQFQNKYWVHITDREEILADGEMLSLTDRLVNKDPAVIAIANEYRNVIGGVYELILTL